MRLNGRGGEGLGRGEVVEAGTVNGGNIWAVVRAELLCLGGPASAGYGQWSRTELKKSPRTIWDMRGMLLLLLQMKHTSASQASWLSMRMPPNAGARRRKLASTSAHCRYSAVRLRCREK